MLQSAKIKEILMKRRTRILQNHKAFPENGLYMAGWCILALAAFLILIKNIFFPGFLVLEHMRQSITCFYTSLNDEEASQA